MLEKLKEWLPIILLALLIAQFVFGYLSCSARQDIKAARDSIKEAQQGLNDAVSSIKASQDLLKNLGDSIAMTQAKLRSIDEHVASNNQNYQSSIQVFRGDITRLRQSIDEQTKHEKELIQRLDKYEN